MQSVQMEMTGTQLPIGLLELSADDQRKNPHNSIHLNIVKNAVEYSFVSNIYASTISMLFIVIFIQILIQLINVG